MRPKDPTRTCSAHNRQGKRCGNAAMRGQRVCRYHGGMAPQSLEAARRRLRDLVDPAISAIATLIRDRNANIRLAASRDVLDRAGLKASDRVEIDQQGRTIIEIELIDRSKAEAPRNGHVTSRT
jgi:hypothetical protein